MVLPPDHIIVISCLDLDPRGLNVVFKILMFMSAGSLTTGYTNLIGLPITVLAACMVRYEIFDMYTLIERCIVKSFKECLQSDLR
jgi:hypothetical protein